MTPSPARLLAATLILSGVAFAQYDGTLPRGKNSTDFAQGPRGKTGPIDWVKDAKTGKIAVTLERNGRYVPGTFLGRGPDGSDYFTFSSKNYRLSLPPPAAPGSSAAPSGIPLPGHWRPIGGIAGSIGRPKPKTQAQNNRPDVEFTEIPASEIPPANMLSQGAANQSPSSSDVPVLTEFKEQNGSVMRTLELPHQGPAFVVAPAPCFGQDAYVSPDSPSLVYILSRDPQTKAFTGFKQVSTGSANADPCASVGGEASEKPSGKPSYSLTPIDTDQYRLIYIDEKGARQDLMVLKLKDKLYCTNSISPPKTFVIETDGSLTAMNSDTIMANRCNIKANALTRQP